MECKVCGLTAVEGKECLHTVRLGSGRATHDAAWSASKPWQVFVRGTATNSFATLGEVYRYLDPTGQERGEEVDKRLANIR